MQGRIHIGFRNCISLYSPVKLLLCPDPLCLLLSESTSIVPASPAPLPVLWFPRLVRPSSCNPSCPVYRDHQGANWFKEMLAPYSAADYVEVFASLPEAAPRDPPPGRNPASAAGGNSGSSEGIAGALLRAWSGRSPRPSSGASFSMVLAGQKSVVGLLDRLTKPLSFTTSRLSSAGGTASETVLSGTTSEAVLSGTASEAVLSSAATEAPPPSDTSRLAAVEPSPS